MQVTLGVDDNSDDDGGADASAAVVPEVDGERVQLVIFKSNDDLRQEMFAMQLIHTIRDVASGMRLINPVTVRAAAEALDKKGLGILRGLDANDRQIARLIALGYSDKQIAETVYLGLQTVRNRVSRLLSRFDKENRTQLALFFAEYHDEIPSN